MKTYIGLDVGSVSVKLAQIDENENLLNSIYLRNCGLVETVKEAMETMVSTSEGNTNSASAPAAAAMVASAAASRVFPV